MYRNAFSITFIFILCLFWVEIQIIRCQNLRAQSQETLEITSYERDYTSHHNNNQTRYHIDKAADDSEGDISRANNAAENSIIKDTKLTEDDISKLSDDSEEGIAISKTSDESDKNTVKSIDEFKNHGESTTDDPIPGRYDTQINSNTGKSKNESPHHKNDIILADDSLNNHTTDYGIDRATSEFPHTKFYKFKDDIDKTSEESSQRPNNQGEDDTYIVSTNESPHHNSIKNKNQGKPFDLKIQGNINKTSEESIYYNNIQSQDNVGKTTDKSSHHHYVQSKEDIVKISDLQIQDDIDKITEELSHHNIQSDHEIGKPTNTLGYQVEKLQESSKTDNFERNPMVTQISFYDFTKDLTMQSDNDTEILHNNNTETTNNSDDDIMTRHSMELRSKDNRNETNVKARFKSRNGKARLKPEPRKPKSHKHKTSVKQEGEENKVKIKDLGENRDQMHTHMTPESIHSYTESKEFVTKSTTKNRERDIKKLRSWERISKNQEEKVERVNSETSSLEVVRLSKHKDRLAERTRVKSNKLQYGSKSNRKPVNAEKCRYLNPYNLKGQLCALKKKLECNATIEQEVIGRTVEYNDIILWKIKEKRESDEVEGIDDEERKRFKHKTVDESFRLRKGKTQYADDRPEKKIVFIVHGLTVMGWPLLKCLSDIKRLEKLIGFYIDNLDCFDIYLIPMANPDGVTKTSFRKPSWLRSSTGMWNKNMSPQKACPGVNLDRNFDIGWNATVVKNMSSCSQQYPGPSPFSELETQAIRDVFKRYSHKMIGFFHVHAGSPDTTVFRGDAVLYPKGYTDVQMDDDRYVDLKGEIEEAMRNTSFNVLGVIVDTLYNWYGQVFGTSVDYASTVFGIPYSLDLSMQLYEDDTLVSKEDDREQNTALTEIWQIVFDVIFNHMYKSLERKD